MVFAGRKEIIGKISRFAKDGYPFLFAIDFGGENGFVLTPAEATARGILYSFSGEGNIAEKTGAPPGRFSFEPVGRERYLEAFSKVQHHLRRGDTYLLNLTFATPVTCDLGLRELFLTGYAPFRLYVPGLFAVFSPEPFVFIRNGTISSFPMKGTIRADEPDAAGRILADEKEFFEHNTIVDLIRNDLSMVATGVHVRRFRYIDRITTNRGDLLQVSSEICGDLPGDYRNRLGEIIFSLLPAGSVTGAPKERTVEIIRDAEDYDRGFYTGIFGFFDGESLVSAVSIRFLQQTEGGLVFKSGGGITALSDPGREYEELLEKIYVPVV